MYDTTVEAFNTQGTAVDDVSGQGHQTSYQISIMPETPYFSTNLELEEKSN